MSENENKQKDNRRQIGLNAHSVTNIILSIAIAISGFFLKNAYVDLNNAIGSLEKITTNITRLVDVINTRIDKIDEEHHELKSEVKELRDGKIVNIQDELNKLRVQLNEVKTRQQVYHGSGNN